MCCYEKIKIIKKILQQHDMRYFITHIKPALRAPPRLRSEPSVLLLFLRSQKYLTPRIFLSPHPQPFISFFVQYSGIPRYTHTQHVKYAFIVFTALLYTAPGCDKLPRAAVDTYTLQQCITSSRRSDTIHHPAAAITACACGKTSLSGSGREQSRGLKINHVNLTEEKSEIHKQANSAVYSSACTFNFSSEIEHTHVHESNSYIKSDVGVYHAVGKFFSFLGFNSSSNPFPSPYSLCSAARNICILLMHVRFRKKLILFADVS